MTLPCHLSTSAPAKLRGPVWCSFRVTLLSRRVCVLAAPDAGSVVAPATVPIASPAVATAMPARFHSIFISSSSTEGSPPRLGAGGYPPTLGTPRSARHRLSPPITVGHGRSRAVALRHGP